MTDLPAFHWRAGRSVRGRRWRQRVEWREVPHPVGSYRDGVLRLVALPWAAGGVPVDAPGDYGRPPTLADWARRITQGTERRTGRADRTADIVELLSSTNDLLLDLTWRHGQLPAEGLLTGTRKEPRISDQGGTHGKEG